MEHEEFTSDNLVHSPGVSQGFQADKFLKKNNYLSIPDTILEHSSGESSGSSIKIDEALNMEDPNELSKSLVSKEQENINYNQSVRSDEASSCSTVIAVDNSFIINCERKLLENSRSDDEKNRSRDKSMESGFFQEMQRKLGYGNGTISTPPSLLRKENSILRSELAEAYEFHDLELKILKEEELLCEGDPQNNLEKWVEKYGVLMDLYTSLKSEYDEYRKEQEKIQYKAADCLESLCSQIEASDSSLNFSGASFVSFNNEIKSSTMLGNFSEVEATVVHDGTILVNDPLSITNDVVFKTPMHTPLKSAKKLFPQESSIIKDKPTVKEVKNIKDLISKFDSTVPLNSEYSIKLLDIETALYDKMKEVEDLEQRLFKIEDFSTVLQNEHDRIKSLLVKENNDLREKISKKSEQLEELTQRLFTEIIALKPSLKDSLADTPGTKLLAVLIETIMESCKNIQDELFAKYSGEKAEWEAQKKVELTTIESLENQIKSLNEKILAQEGKLGEFEHLKKINEDLIEKLSQTENIILTRDEEIRLLQSHDANIRRTRDDLAAAKETITKLELQITWAEAEKKELEDRCQRLGEMNTNLKNDVDLKGTLLQELENKKSCFDSVQRENESLKNIIQQSEGIISDLKTELDLVKSDKDEILQEMENLRNKENFKLDNLFECVEDNEKQTNEDLAAAGEAIAKLETQLSRAHGEISEMESKCHKLEKHTSKLLVEIESHETRIKDLEMINGRVETKNAELNREITQLGEVIDTLKTGLEVANEEKNNKELRLKDLLTEVDLLKREKEDLVGHSRKLQSIEEEKKNLTDVLLDIQSRLDDSLADTPGTKLLAVLIETIVECCKNIQDELPADYSGEKEWEARKKVELTTIESVENQIKSLNEKILAQEGKLGEFEDLKKMNDDLIEKLSQTEKIILTRDEEIRLLQSRDDLAAAKETITKLELQITVAEAEKKELEDRCQRLEEMNTNLKNDVDLKGTLLQELENKKSCFDSVQRENESLQNIIQQSEGIISDLKTELDLVKSDKDEILQEMENLRNNENRKLDNLFECLEENKNTVLEMLVNESPCLDEDQFFQENLQESSNTKFTLLFKKSLFDCGKLVKEELNKQFSNEKAEWEAKRNADLTLIENLQNTIKTHVENKEHEMKLSEITLERNNLKKLCETLEEQLSEVKSIISSRDEEILLLKKQETLLKQIKGDLALSEEAVLKLKAQLLTTESEKIQIEKRCFELEDANANLKTIINTKDTVLNDLENFKVLYEKVQNECENIKQLNQELQLINSNLKTQLEIARDNQSMSDSKIEELSREIDYLKLQTTLAEGAVSNLENRCRKLEEDNLTLQTSCNDAIISKNELLEKLESISGLQCENEDLKDRIKETDKIIADLRADLELTMEEQKERLSRVNELVQEVENLKQENENMMKALKESREGLADALSDKEAAEGMPGDRITKYIMGKADFSKSESSQTKMLSIFMEIISESCRGVQDELIKKFDIKKVEWESQRKVDLSLINSLENQVKAVEVKNKENESKISEIHKEKDDLRKIYDALADQMSEKEKILGSFKEELQELQSQEGFLKQTKGELAAAGETIAKLETQLSRAHGEISEMESKCHKLEKHTSNLLVEIESHETRIKDLEMINGRVETKNAELNREITQLGEVIDNLKTGLEVANEEKNNKELRLKDLLTEVDLLKREKEDLVGHSRKLQSIEEEKKNLTDVLLDIQSCLDMPSDTMAKLVSGNLENRKIFSERINKLVKTQMEELRLENKSLKFGNDNLKDKVKELSKMNEIVNSQLKERMSTLDGSLPPSAGLRNKPGKNVELCARRLDKLEEINHNLLDLLTRILTMTDFPDLEKLKLGSVRDFPNVVKKVVAHIKEMESKVNALKAENSTLDEECESYAKTIKDLQKEAVVVWKTNQEKTMAMEAEISRLKEEKIAVEKEKQEMLAKIAKLETECQKLKSGLRPEGSLHACLCGNEMKKINDLKRAILMKEQKILELQDLESKNAVLKSQLEYLERALEREKKKNSEEKQKNKRLQDELNEATSKHQKAEDKNSEENQMLEELRMRGSISGGIVQEIVDKEKMRKLAKDIGILKELCRARYAEIKRLEAENAALRNATPKNSNQMDSPLRTRGYNTRSKNPVRDLWKTEISGKENSAL